MLATYILECIAQHNRTLLENNFNQFGFKLASHTEMVICSVKQTIESSQRNINISLLS